VKGECGGLYVFFVQQIGSRGNEEVRFWLPVLEKRHVPEQRTSPPRIHTTKVVH
jgi:hypothetical protein